MIGKEDDGRTTTSDTFGPITLDVLEKLADYFRVSIVDDITKNVEKKLNFQGPLLLLPLLLR